MRTSTFAAAASLAAVALAAAPSLAEPFSFNPPGMLTPGSGEGRYDEHVYAPGMLFPLEEGPAFLNSQVWGNGGSQGPGGGQCDPENRQYPWWDNYCETRTWDMPLCPAGTGHQGQDIRAGDCQKEVHWVVAAEDGTITNVGTYSVYLTTEDGTRFDYLHMGNVQVALGDEIKRGQHLGMVSNEFGGTPTTIHLHFNIKQDVDGVGFVFVPPYLSLVASYQVHLNTPPSGVVSQATCERVRGASLDPDTPAAPNDVRLSVGGPSDDPNALGFDVPADRATSLLCDGGAASCDRGFDTMLPISLLDGKTRDLHVYALDTTLDGVEVELEQSPATVTCDLFSTEGLARRALPGDAGAWGFDLFFDELPIAPDEAAALTKSIPLPDKPVLVTSEDGASHWIDDDEGLRPIDEPAMWMFRLDPAQAEVWTAAEVSARPEGAPWPSRPAIIHGDDGALYLLDHAPPGETPLDADPEPEPEAATAACGCRAAGGPAEAAGALSAAAMGLVVGLRRRRRHRGAKNGAHLG